MHTHLFIVVIVATSFVSANVVSSNARLIAYCDNYGSASYASDGVNFVVKNSNFRFGPNEEADISFNDINRLSKIRINCRDDGGRGGFAATLHYDGLEYYTDSTFYGGQNVLSLFNWKLIDASDNNYVLNNNIAFGAYPFVTPNANMNENAYFVWNSNTYNTLIFEFDFSYIIASPAPTKSPIAGAPTFSPGYQESFGICNSNGAVSLDSTGDGYTHFRICEGNTATFSCPNSDEYIHLGACWYGSPINDPGYNQCPHSFKAHCDHVIGNCVSYISDQCEGKNECSITINNDNMGATVCNYHKFAAVALQCRKRGSVIGSGNSHDIGFNGYSHFRICEDETGSFSCSVNQNGISEYINIGACWYGSPSNDPGYDQCPHSNKGHCDYVTGNCLSYMQNECQGKTSCHLTINDANMGTTASCAYHKFGAVAMQCRAQGSVSSSGTGILDIGHGADGYSHFRVCEDNTATFSCPSGEVLNLGGCWYGSPITDGGYDNCPHALKADCGAPVIGNCINYISNQCNGQQQCSVTINNVNMGATVCNYHKFAGIALQCQSSGASILPNVHLNHNLIKYNNINGNYILLGVVFILSFIIGNMIAYIKLKSKKIIH